MHRRAIAPVALVSLVLLAAVLMTRYGVRLHNPQQDEYEAVFGGRFFAHDPFAAISDTTFFHRGPERLTSALLAVPDAIFSSTPLQMQAGHALTALAYALTALPAYHLARGLGLDALPSTGTAALAILSPWLVFGLTYLDVAVACSTLALFFYASWNAAVRPSWRADSLVLVAAALAVTGRVGAAPFLAVTAIVALVAAWHAVDGVDLRSRAGRLPRTLVRRHPLLTPLGVLVLAVVLSLGPRSLAGPAYNGAINGFPTADQIWAYLPVHFAELSMGTGYLPMIVGLPWLTVQLVRPATPATHAFAVIAFASFFVFVGLAAQAGATLEERYVAVLGILPVVAFGAAIWSRKVLLVGTAVAAVIVARAVVTRGVYPADDPFSYFVAPARQFFSNVIQGRLSVAVHVGDAHVASVALLIAGLLAVAFVAILRGSLPPFGDRPSAIVTWTVVGVLCLTGTAGGLYAMRKFTALAGSPNLTWKQLAFIDDAVGPKGAMSYNSAVSGDRVRVFEFELARFFNARIGDAFDPRQHLDNRTGLIMLPRVPYLVQLDGFSPYALNARPIGPSSTLFGPTGLQIARFEGKPSVLAVATGAPGGILAPRRPLRIKALAADTTRSCVSIPVTGGTAGSSVLRYRVSWRGGSSSGSVRPNEVRRLHGPFAAGRVVTLTATGAGKTLDGRPVSLYLGAIDVRPCPR